MIHFIAMLAGYLILAASCFAATAFLVVAIINLSVKDINTLNILYQFARDRSRYKNKLERLQEREKQIRIWDQFEPAHIGKVADNILAEMKRDLNGSTLELEPSEIDGQITYYIRKGLYHAVSRSKVALVALLLVSSAAFAQPPISGEHHQDTTAYRQPSAELEALRAMAAGDDVTWRQALAAPARDTVLAQYIIYADTAGLVRYLEDVWVIRHRNQHQQLQQPLHQGDCMRVLWSRYYAEH